MTTDPQRFREVLGHYPTGVALVTGISTEGEPIGMIVGSFTSVSLDPPLVAYLPMTTSYTFAQLREADCFVVNVLSAEQEQLCRRFASRIEDKWAGVKWTASPGGAPILEDSVAWIECTTESISEAGDHYLVMGRVQDLAVIEPSAPLLFFQGGYGKFTITSLVATSAPDLINATKLVEIARPELESMCERTGLACDVVADAGGDLVFVGAAASSEELIQGPALGSRIPLMAPLGEQYIAWKGEEAIEAWMNRSGVFDPDARAALIARLEGARERGWSMSRIAADDETDFYDLLRDYVDGELTPARERALRARIAEFSELYAAVEIVPTATYRPHTIVVPVLAASGKPLLTIRLIGMPRTVTGQQITDWVTELKACSAAITARITATC